MNTKSFSDSGWFWSVVMRITVRMQAFSTLIRITLPRMTMRILAPVSAYFLPIVRKASALAEIQSKASFILVPQGKNWR